MKKFWLLIFCSVLVVSLGCQSDETTSHRKTSDDSEERATDANEDGKLEAKRHKKDQKTSASSEELDETDFDSGEETRNRRRGEGSMLENLGILHRKPKAVEIPPYKPLKIAAKAMELYDSNGDGKLDEEELEAFPAMLFSLKCPKSIDTNADGVIDKAEIQARIQAWIDAKVGLACPIIKFVDQKGRVPTDVIGKKVILIPDPVHEGMLKATEPIEIDENGQCSPSTPGNFDNLSGMPWGFYTITIEGTPYQNLGVETFDGAMDEESISFNIELKK